MSTCKTLKPHVHMTEKAGRGHGVGVHEAVAAASARIEVLRGDAMARIDGIMVRLGALRDTTTTDPASEPREMRKLADELAGLCGAFGLSEVGSAASSLCRLLDLGNPCPARHAAIAVHLDALQLFSRAEPHARAHAASGVLAGLRQIVVANEAER